MGRLVVRTESDLDSIVGLRVSERLDAHLAGAGESVKPALRREAVVHVTTGLTPAAGGPYNSVAGLVRSLAHESVYAPIVACPLFSPAADLHDSAHWSGVPVLTLAATEGRRMPAPRGLLAERIMQREPVVLHLHGLWDAGSLFAERMLAESRMRFVLSPRGMLEPWAISHKRLKKKIFTLLCMRELFARVELLHATSESEAESLRSFGLRQPIAVIPNGIEGPPAAEAAFAGAHTERPRLLYLGRLHVKKGLENLLEAWAMVRPAGWSLAIAGIDEGGYQRRLESRAAELRIIETVEFPGPLFGAAKWRFLASGDAFVHPSFSENFGIAVAEAMVGGLPVIATKGTPWDVLAERELGWWVQPTPAALAGALREMASLPRSRLRAMGSDARAYATAAFAWPAIGRSMADCYDWLLGHNPPPQCIRFQ